MKKIQMVDLRGQYPPVKDEVNSSIQEVISLPMHTELDNDQIDFITASVLSFLT